MFRTKETRVRTYAITKGGETTYKELEYCIDNKNVAEKIEARYEENAKLEEMSLEEKYVFKHDKKTKYECLDDLFDLIAVKVKETIYDRNGIEILMTALTDDDRKSKLNEMYERVKRGLELVAEEEAYQEAIAKDYEEGKINL